MRRLIVAVQESWDAAFARLYYPVMCAALAAMTVYTARRGDELSRDWDEWSVADWLISYPSGFARRGLSGELVLWISATLGVPANTVVFAIVVMLFAALSVLVAILLRQRRITFWYFILCLSPGFLFFTFYDPFTVGRKEILLYVAFCAWAVRLIAGRGYPRLRTHIAFAISCFVLTLMHEVFAFYSVYFVLMSYLVARDRGVPGGSWRASLTIPAASLLALAIVTLFSAPVTDPAQCARLTTLGAPPRVCTGVLSFEVGTTGEALKSFVNGFEWPTVAGLAGVFPVILVPLALFLVGNTDEPGNARATLGLVAALIVMTLPLFVVGRDWGRWISIHVVLSTITVAMFLPETRAAARTSRATAAGPLVAGLCMVCLMFSWSLRHCCEYEYLNAFGPLERVLLR